MKKSTVKKVLSLLLVLVMMMGTMSACIASAPAEDTSSGGAESTDGGDDKEDEADDEGESEAEDTNTGDYDLSIPESFSEAPMLAEKVASGELPPVEERVPSDPLVIPGYESTGMYGGYLRIYAPSTDSFDDLHWNREANWLKKESHSYFAEGENNMVLHRAAAFESNEDYTEFTVTLRDGLKWSDGTPVTTEDLRYAAEDVWMYDELAAWWGGWLSDNRPTVEVIDELNIKYTFASPAPAFLNDQTGWASNQGLGVGETPSHYLKDFHIMYNENAEEEAIAEGYNSWMDRYIKVSDCGPGQTDLNLPTVNAWVLKSKDTTQKVYERNPYFWAVDEEGQQLPYLDGYVVEAVSDIEVAKLKLIGGDFDIAGQFLIQLNEYPMLIENEETSGYEIELAQGDVTAFPSLSFNQNHNDPVLQEIFSNPEFSKAMSHAIDREEINQIVYAGLAEPMQSTYITSEHFDNSEYKTMYTEYDPELAISMLEGMGLERDADGNFLRPDGEVLTINLQTIVEEGWGDATELIASHWTEIGVITQYNPTERTLFDERKNANELDLWVWHDREQATEFNSSSKGDELNNWRFSDSQVMWDEWYTSEGAEGIEPPQEYQDYVEDAKALALATPGSDEYMELAQKVWDFRIKDTLYVIGTVGNAPKPLLVKNGLENVGNLEVPFDYWYAQYPEQFYWSDEARRSEILP